MRRLSMILCILVVWNEIVVLAETENWETLNTAGMLAYQEKDFATAKELFGRALETLDQSDQPNPLAATISITLVPFMRALVNLRKPNYGIEIPWQS